ncbi:MAG: efflux RND transporter periplasmic adaptor subunit [Muribaculaceae bacterium]|nr:efflux RND transporter periplasmic adaptor subunit [Muribaculaceae bacterium]
MKLSVTFGWACVAIALIASCSKKASDENVQEVQPEVEKPIVKVELVTEESVPQTTDYTATVEAYKTNNITTSTMNRIKNILVDVGSNVRAGQTVVILDDVNIAQMELRLNNQKKDYDRALQLLEIGGGTQQQVDQLRTEYEAAQRSYQNMVENTRLVSPINGVVTARNFDNGDMTGQLPILTIEQIQPVKVIINVAEKEFSKIKIGMPVSIKLDVYGEEEFSGKVSLIYPTIDASTRTFQVEINIANANTRIRPGMFARVQINYGNETRVVVPDLAIVKQTGSGNRYVYVYENGKVSFNRVELGRRIGNRYELISGVPNNSQVVVSGQSFLADGVEVQLANEEIAAIQ